MSNVPRIKEFKAEILETVKELAELMKEVTEADLEEIRSADDYEETCEQFAFIISTFEEMGFGPFDKE